MKYIISLLLCLLSIPLCSQNEAANWYFGYGAGIKFNLANSSVSPVNDGQLFTNEGCTSISDESGNLLFYTDGSTIWDKTHSFMLNGLGLLGDASSTQSAIIVPKPKNPTIYYVFTVDNSLSGFNAGLNYSVVDMSLNGGLGAVTTKNTNLLELCSEKLTAVLKDCITKSIWVLTFASENGDLEFFDTFHAFEVSETGVNTTAVKSKFPISILDARGYLKLSPDGTKMACANFTADQDNSLSNDELFLYDFDVATGIASNQIALTLPGENHNPYGVEFSPNSQLLYIHASNNFRRLNNSGPGEIQVPEDQKSALVQFNLSAPDIQNSQIVIDDRILYRGGLQLGPDGKIYRALSATYSDGLPYLGVINNPNIVGTGCNYRHNAINLSPNLSSQGLPPFIQSLFNVQIDIIKNGKSDTNLALCDGDSYRLVSEKMPGATYVWKRDNIVLAENNYDLLVTQSGHYEVVINPNNGDCEIEGQAYVIFNENPKAYNASLIQCDEDGQKDGLTLFNLKQAHAELTNNVPNLTSKFYLDANRQVQLNGNSFSNTSNPQTIYVEIIDNATGCLSTSELTLLVSSTDANDVILPAVCDDDGVEDGLHIFHLKEAESSVINGLMASDLTISYFESYNDALLETKKLNETYVNKVPYAQTIYARVENSNNCYGISEVTLKVHKLPNIRIEDSVFYCLNKFPETITLDAAILNDSASNYTYIWSNGDSTYETQINQTGVYTVTVTNSDGCSKKRTIIVEPSNIANFQSIDITDVTQANSITVLVSGEGIYQYALFNTSNNISIPYQDSNTFQNIAPGIYNVFVKDIKNDCGVVEDQVSVIGYPKFFTPNDDNFNDTWQVIGVSEVFQPNTRISIYNRFGKLMKQINPLGEGWNGLYNGEKLPTDDYWFTVELQDGRVFKDHFTLKN